MITHTVLFELTDPTPENLRVTAEVLRAMDGQIPTLVDVEVGIDQLRGERSYHIVLRTRHRTWADLEAYQTHPVHEQVKGHMRTVLSRSASVDFGEDETASGAA